MQKQKVLRTTANMIHELLSNMIKAIKIRKKQRMQKKMPKQQSTAHNSKNDTWTLVEYDKSHQKTAGTQNDTTSPRAIRLKPTACIYRSLDVYSRDLGSPKQQFWYPMILRGVTKHELKWWTWSWLVEIWCKVKTIQLDLYPTYFPLWVVRRKSLIDGIMLWLTFRELIYPTLGKDKLLKSSSKVPFGGDMWSFPGR